MDVALGRVVLGVDEPEQALQRGRGYLQAGQLEPGGLKGINKEFHALALRQPEQHAQLLAVVQRGHVEIVAYLVERDRDVFLGFQRDGLAPEFPLHAGHHEIAQDAELRRQRDHGRRGAPVHLFHGLVERRYPGGLLAEEFRVKGKRAEHPLLHREAGGKFYKMLGIGPGVLARLYLGNADLLGGDEDTQRVFRL